jgi:hypothetical protein
VRERKREKKILPIRKTQQKKDVTRKFKKARRRPSHRLLTLLYQLHGNSGRLLILFWIGLARYTIEIRRLKHNAILPTEKASRDSAKHAAHRNNDHECSSYTTLYIYITLHYMLHTLHCVTLC